MGDRGGKLSREGLSRLRKQRLLLRTGLVTLAAVVALVAWLATRGNDQGGDEPAARAETSTTIVSTTGLAAAAAKLGQPVYWAGSLPGSELELEELSEGGARVVYLPAGEGAGTDSTAALAIGSYPLADPAAALRKFAARPGAVVRRAPATATEVVSSREQPTSVYFAGPDNSGPGRGLRSLAASGRCAWRSRAG